MKLSALTVVALSSTVVLQSDCSVLGSTKSCLGPIKPEPTPVPVDPSNKNLPFLWPKADQKNWNPFDFNNYQNDKRWNPGNYIFNFDHTNKDNNFFPSWFNFQDLQWKNKPNVSPNIILPSNLNFDSWSSSSNNLQLVQPISFNLNDYQKYLASKNTGNGNQPNINLLLGQNFGHSSNNNQGGWNFGQLPSSGSFNGGISWLGSSNLQGK